MAEVFGKRAEVDPVGNEQRGVVVPDLVESFLRGRSITRVIIGLALGEDFVRGSPAPDLPAEIAWGVP